MAGIAGATVPIATRVGDHPKTTAGTEQLGGRYAYATLITSDDFFHGFTDHGVYTASNVHDISHSCPRHRSGR